MVFTHKAVCLCAESDDDIAQHTVIHIQTTLPDDLACVDIQLISLLDMVVKQGSKQVVGGGDCVEISGKMEIQILHRNDLCISAACGTAFDAKARSE